MAGHSPEAIRPDDWAGEMGEKWNRNIEQLESMITAVGNAVIEFAGFRRGERVIDIGCGGGPTTFQIAELIGDEGHVTGVDVSPDLISTARARQKELGAANIDFVAADAATADFERRYDCLFSRFGVMFFDDPYAAFKNLARALAPGGRVAICCWGPPQANPWIGELMAILAEHVELPQRDPREPGPFALGDKDYLTDILSTAGFGDIELTVWKGDIYPGGAGADAQTATEFALDATPIGNVLEDATDATRTAVTQALTEMLRGRQTANGITLQGTAWFVAARAH